MAILIDTPRWPAHGTVFGHLASDHSLTALHRFARANDLDIRAFDHDHFDVAEHHFDRLVDAGAEHISSRELVTRLSDSGLRVRRPDKLPSPASLVDPLRQQWTSLLPEDPTLGDRLVTAWSAPTRHYHDPRHLSMMLAALEQLEAATPELQLATWFHDAVYDGVPVQDEEASAAWAEQALSGLVPTTTVAEVARLVRLTITHAPSRDDEAGQALSDADLSTLAGPEGRYWMYARAIRMEYAHLDDASFRRGRAGVLQGFLDSERIFHTDRGRDLWESQARSNLAGELDFLLHD
jgi:predicted metal-dependent HD superfamily phosphohydrolase